MAIKIDVDCFPGNAALNGLFVSAWGAASERDFASVLAHSLGHVCAYDGEVLVGFVNLAWDGGVHGFVLDTCVHADFQRRGIATKMVRRVVEIAAAKGLDWVHVDFEPHLADFYAGCGFRASSAGIINVTGHKD